MRDFMRRVIPLAFSALLAAGSVVPAAPARAQNLFEPVIRVNDMAITRFEIEQRARMLTLFRAPGDPVELAREQLIDDRLRLDAARANGLVLDQDQLLAGMEEFAGRANMDVEQFTRALEGSGVDPATFREFVRAGLTWRELVRARFSNRVSVTEEDLERARLAIGATSGVRVLMSEIILPAPPSQILAVQERAARIAEIETAGEFSAAARRFSAAPSAARGGQLDWLPITDLPPPLRTAILALAPGEVTDPLPTENAIALFQLRDIEETDAPAREYSAIEYAIYYIPGGRSEAALQRAAQVNTKTDVCDDLYGVAYGQPPEVLVRESKAPAEIPQAIAFELAKLDPGEVSTTLTSVSGEALMLIMLCGRSPLLEGDGPTAEELTGFIRNRRLDSFANAYLEQLRAEARIVEKE